MEDDYLSEITDSEEDNTYICNKCKKTFLYLDNKFEKIVEHHNNSHNSSNCVSFSRMKYSSDETRNFYHKSQDEKYKTFSPKEDDYEDSLKTNSSPIIYTEPKRKYSINEPIMTPKRPLKNSISFNGNASRKQSFDIEKSQLAKDKTTNVMQVISTSCDTICPVCGRLGIVSGSLNIQEDKCLTRLCAYIPLCMPLFYPYIPEPKWQVTVNCTKCHRELMKFDPTDHWLQVKK